MADHSDITDTEIIAILHKRGYVTLTKYAFDQMRQDHVEHVAQAQALIAAKEADGTAPKVAPISDLEGTLEDMSETLTQVINDLRVAPRMKLSQSVDAIKGVIRVLEGLRKYV